MAVGSPAGAHRLGTVGVVILSCGTGLLVRSRFPSFPVSGSALLLGIVLGITHGVPPLPVWWRSTAAAVLFASVGVRMGTSASPLCPRPLLGRLLGSQMAAAAAIGVVVVVATHDARAAWALGVVGAASSVAVAGGAGAGGTTEALTLAASDDLVGLALLWVLAPRSLVLGLGAVSLLVLGLAGSRTTGQRSAATGLAALAVASTALLQGAGAAASPLVPLGALVAALSLARWQRPRRRATSLATRAGRDLATPTFFLLQGLTLHSLTRQEILLGSAILAAVVVSRYVWVLGRGSTHAAAATTARGVVTFVGLQLASEHELVGSHLVAAMTVAVLMSALLASVAIELTRRAPTLPRAGRRRLEP